MRPNVFQREAGRKVEFNYEITDDALGVGSAHSSDETLYFFSGGKKSRRG